MPTVPHRFFVSPDACAGIHDRRASFGTRAISRPAQLRLAHAGPRRRIDRVQRDPTTTIARLRPQNAAAVVLRGDAIMSTPSVDLHPGLHADGSDRSCEPQPADLPAPVEGVSVSVVLAVLGWLVLVLCLRTA